jgi:hypothetical protein
MTTYYTQIPTLEMRVMACTLIIIGTVGKVVGTQVDYYEHEPFVRTTYEVTIQEVLKGALEQVIHVEVMGGESEGRATPLHMPMYEGSLLVLMLVSQAGSDAFVPYFNSAFPLNLDGQIALGTQAAETLSSQIAQINSESISLDLLRVLVTTVVEREATETSAAERAMAGQVLPPVLEMPLGFHGGGEPSEPQVGEQLKSSN